MRISKDSMRVMGEWVDKHCRASKHNNGYVDQLLQLPPRSAFYYCLSHSCRNWLYMSEISKDPTPLQKTVGESARKGKTVRVLKRDSMSCFHAQQCTILCHRTAPTAFPLLFHRPQQMQYSTIQYKKQGSTAHYAD
jgi:hypothetical protein